MKTTNLREAYGQALVEFGALDQRIVVLEADLGNSTRTCLFKAKFPHRYFEMGIAEQNMASTAAGLALVGKMPFINSFAVFAAGRAYDQIRNVICIPKLPVRICGSSSGLSDFADGKTHQAVEDAAIMRAIPNMTVLVPVDAVETRAMVLALLDYPGPVYMRLNRNDLPIYTPEDNGYQIGLMPTIREGQDIVVFANGIMVSRAMAAAEALEAEHISVKVVNVSTMKPLDRDAILGHLAPSTRGVIVAEEHTLVGGLLGAILESVQGSLGVPIKAIGIKDSFGTSAASYDELLAHYGLTNTAIANAARSLSNGASDSHRHS
jgi:transketolase